MSGDWPQEGDDAIVCAPNRDGQTASLKRTQVKRATDRMVTLESGHRFARSRVHDGEACLVSRDPWKPAPTVYAPGHEDVRRYLRNNEAARALGQLQHAAMMLDRACRRSGLTLPDPTLMAQLTDAWERAERTVRRHEAAAGGLEPGAAGERHEQQQEQEQEEQPGVDEGAEQDGGGDNEHGEHDEE